MEKFLIALFRITLWEALALAVVTGIKLLLVHSGTAARIGMPVLWLAVTAFVILIAAVSAGGYLENKGHTPESWVAEKPQSAARRRLALFINVGVRAPLLFGVLLGVLMIAPTTTAMAGIMLAVILLSNVFRLLRKRPDAAGETS